MPTIGRIWRELPNLWPYLAIAALGWFSGYGMNFLIDQLFTPASVGTFTFLFSIASINQLVANSANMVLAPRFYRVFNVDDFQEAERGNQIGYVVLALTLGVVSFVTIGLLPWVASSAGGSLAHYGDSRLELAFLMIGYIVIIPWWHGQNYYFVAGLARPLMSLSIWSGLAGLAAWALCMMAIGPPGIFLGFALQMGLRSIWMLNVGRTRWALKTPVLAIIAGVAMSLLALGLPSP